MPQPPVQGPDDEAELLFGTIGTTPVSSVFSQSKNRSVLAVGPGQAFAGWNTFLGAVTANPAVTGTTVPQSPTKSASVNTCTSYSSVASTLNIDASLGVSWGLSSVSAQASFFESLTTTQTSVNVIAIAKNTNTISATSAQLTPAAQALLNSGDLVSFQNLYGDQYVNSLTYGILYIGVYTFWTQTSQQQQSVAASIKASSPVVDATLSAKMSSVAESSQTDVSFRSQLFGYGDQLPPGLNLNDVQAMANFVFSLAAPTQASSTNVNSFTTAGYEGLLSGTQLTAYQPVVKNRALVNGLQSNGAYISASSFNQSAITAYSIFSQCTYLSAIYATYGYTGDANMTALMQNAQADLVTIRNALSAISSNPAVPASLPPLNTKPNQYPQLSVSLQNPTSWGGTGGGPFQDATINSVYLQQTVSQMQMSGGLYVDSLTVTYSLAGVAVPPVTHGNTSGGTGSTPLVIAANDRITGIGVNYGNYVNMLTFQTQNSGSLQWPPNPQISNTSAFLNVRAGTALLGFSGRSGTYVDQIQFVTVQFSPATYTTVPPQ